MTLNPANRLELSTTIENLINMLDALEPDPDLEDGADAEPYLAGWSGTNDDREAVNEDGGDINDEPQDNDEREHDPAELGIADADGLAWMSTPMHRGRSPRGNPALSPEDYPDQFCMRADGSCCEPEISDGGYVLVDKTRPYKRGDFVCIYRDPATVAKGDHVIKVKRLVEDYPAAMVVEMLNPPRLLFVDKAKVTAVYFCEPAPASFIPGLRKNRWHASGREGATDARR
ncbi:S24 family peptidase [Mesorhizobium sp. CO1-1-2]|uniref:S24 family peptidase n=1 Tax=Mesorhizobium sp. CO1-1-2 TaxID=2876635 RepID=UPI001CCE247A|nr:S24 family peptidase [Mesorhizobium sp. CO1-1-2]MBZ9683130.1 S24 family peptidase [Mesorhizobium sp. CO1-1-2]